MQLMRMPMDRLVDSGQDGPMEITRRLVLVAATLTTGLTAGLLFAFACSVMPALSGADDATFVDVMQRVNVAIVNGWFLACFVGALVLGVLAAGLHLGRAGRPVLVWIVAALVFYLVALAVTGLVNVPLNDTLAATGDPRAAAGAGGITDLAAVRAHFEGRWVAWHLVRTVAAAASLACLAGALLVSGSLGPAQG
jgi:uncharacterized membrane protein